MQARSVGPVVPVERDLLNRLDLVEPIGSVEPVASVEPVGFAGSDLSFSSARPAWARRVDWRFGWSFWELAVVLVLARFWEPACS